MTRPFRFAVWLPLAVESFRRWRDDVVMIEDLGFDAAAIPDHFVDGWSGVPWMDSVHPEPLTTLAAAAASTSTLRFNTLMICNDYRHPVQLHRAAAMVDVISEGRLELGLARIFQ